MKIRDLTMIVRALATIRWIVSSKSIAQLGHQMAKRAPITPKSQGDGGNQSAIVGFFGMGCAAVRIETICV